MKEELKELIEILAQGKERREVLEGIVRAEVRKMLKQLLEEIALVEREAYCESSEDVGNGFYSRNLEGLFGKIEDIEVPRTSETPGFGIPLLPRFNRPSWDHHQS